MTIPKQVLERAERAQKLQGQAPSSADGTPDQQPQAPQPQQAPTPEGAVNLDQAGQDGTPAEAPTQDVQTPPLNTAAAPAPTQQTPIESTDAELRAELARVQNSFNVLKGKYDKEVPELHRQNKQLTQLLTQQQQAPAAPEPQVQQVAQPQFDPSKVNLYEFYDQDTIDSFGEDVLRKQLAAQQKLVQPQISSIQSALDAQVEQNKNMQQAYAQQQQDLFTQMVIQKVPNAVMLNSDPGFLDWASQPASPLDPTLTRFDLLQSAESRRDVDTVARIFNEYKPELQQITPPVNPNQPIPPSVESQAVPQGHSVPPQMQPQQKKTYSAIEYKNLMTRLTQMPKGDERTRLEQELNLAVKELRVKP